MRVIFLTIFAVVFLTHSVNSIPNEFEKESSDVTESKTYSALRNFFQPMMSWFRNDLPKKTPADIANDIKDKAIDVKDWATDNAFFRAAKKVVSPVHTWIKDTANTIKDKTFGDLYDDTKDAASRVDKSVGEWIDSKVPQNAVEFK